MTTEDAAARNVTKLKAERSRLTAITSRILDSVTDADDVLQEAWLRLSRTEDIDDVPAWLTTVVTRLCLDTLRKRRTRSEAREPADYATIDPEAEALLAEQLGGAMQVVIEALEPAERAALVLHDVFGYPFDDISAVLGRSNTAVRQLASRARRKVQGAPNRSRSRPRGPRAGAWLRHSSPPLMAGISRRCCRYSHPTRSCVLTWSVSNRGQIRCTTAQLPVGLASTGQRAHYPSPSTATQVARGSWPGR